MAISSSLRTSPTRLLRQFLRNASQRHENDTIDSTMQLRWFCIFTISGLLLGQSTMAAPSDRFWDPFRNTPSVSIRLQNILNTLIAAIPRVAGNPVSTFRIPDPSFLGIRSRTAYNPGALGTKTTQGGSSRPIPPSPISDKSGHGTPCGGSDTDPYWANDCSCRCSTGGVANLSYAVSDRCPDDDNRTCEDCRKITRHDKHVTTIAECMEPFNADHAFD